MASAIPAAKASLLTIIRAAVLPLDVASDQVTWGWPAALAQREHVWIDDAVTSDRDSVGMVSHRELFIVPVVVYVQSEGDDDQSAEERVWVIVGAIEEAIRFDPSLTNAVGVAQATVTGKTPISSIHDATRVVQCVIDVEVHSRY